MPAVAGSLFIVLPLAAMLTRVDWADFPQLISSPGARTALLLSLKTSSIATWLCLLLGVPMAIVLARITFRGQDVIRSLVLLPLVLPPVVAGIALLYTFGRRGLLGQTFEAFGIQIAFSTTAVIMALIHMPANTYQPYRVLNQCVSMLMSQSQESTLLNTAKPTRKRALRR